MVALRFYIGSGPVLLGNPIFVIFRGGGGGGESGTLSPTSVSAHVGYHQKFQVNLNGSERRGQQICENQCSWCMFREIRQEKHMMLYIAVRLSMEIHVPTWRGAQWLSDRVLMNSKIKTLIRQWKG